MKIPTLQNRGVERLTPEVTPGQIAADFKNKQGLTEQVLDVASKAVEEREVFEAQQVDLDFDAEMDNFDQAEGTQEYFNSEQVGTDTKVQRQAHSVGSNNEEVATDRTRIPSYEVYPDMYKDKAMAEISSRANNVPKKYRSEWKQQKTAEVNAKYSDLTIKSAQAQNNYMREVQTERFNDSLTQRNWKGALKVAGQYKGTDLERKKMKDLAWKMREQSAYDDQITEKQLPELRKSLDFLTSPDEDYMEKGGKLNADERRIQAAQIEGAIGGITTSNNASSAAYDKLLLEDVDSTVKGLNQSRPMDGDSLMALWNKLNRSYERDPDKFAKHRRRLGEMLSLSPSINAVASAHPNERQAIIDASVSGLKGPEKDRALDWLNTASDNAKIQIDTDTVQFGLDIGLIDEMPPLDFNNEAAFMEGLQLRSHNYNKLTTQFGRASGYLSDAEANNLVSFLDKASLDGKIAVSSAVARAYGDNAPVFWEQMGDKMAGPMAIAGGIAMSDPNSSRSILEGHEILKSQHDIIPKTDDYQATIMEGMGGAYPREGHFKAIRQSVDAAYAFLSKQAGDRSGVIVPERAQEAINMVTGGLIEMSTGWGPFGSDYKIPPPVRGMTHDDFDSYIRDVHTEAWRENGGVEGYDHDYEELRDDMRKGRVRLVPTADNEYALVSHVFDPPRALYKNDTEELFMFKYDKDWRQIKRSHTSVRDKRRGKKVTASDDE